MNVKILTIVVGLAVLLCAGGTEVSGQSCVAQFSCSINSLSGQACTPPIPPTAYACWGANWTAYCLVRSNACPAHPECPSCNRAAAPIDLASGNVDIAETDIRIPGLAGGLTLARTWNSIWPSTESAWRVGLFGPNWRSTYEERVFGGSDGYMKYSRGDGSFWSFGYSGVGSNSTLYAVASPANQTATLTQTASNWTLVFQNGETRTFDGTSGYLTSITDRNGNVTQLSYDTAYRLVTVTDAAARHLYFSYASPSTYLVTGVSSDVGVSLSYTYDGLGRLITVTKPDQTTLSFQYDGNSMISAVLDSSNKTLESHTYDNSGRGLTSSRAGGVEAVTVSYP